MNTAKEKLWTGKYVFLLVLIFFLDFSFLMSTVSLTQHTVNLGFSLATAGTIAGIFSIAALCARPFSGWICDNINKKILLMIIIVMCSITVLTFRQHWTRHRNPS